MAKTVTATFTLIPPTIYRLNVVKIGSAANLGIIQSSPLGINCGADCVEYYNAQTGAVTLTRNAPLGASFAGWVGCTNIIGNDCVVIMNGNRTVTATFNTAIAPPPAPVIDLVVTAPTTFTISPTTVARGGTVTFPSFTVKNQGANASGSFSIGFYLATNGAAIDPSDTLLGSSLAGIASIAPGASRTFSSYTRTIPTTVSPGTYTIGIMVDNLTAITESSEANNNDTKTTITVR